MAEETGRLEATFTIDLSPLQRGLRQASGLLQSWAKRHEDDTEAEVRVNLSPLMRGLSDASRALKQWERTNDVTAEIKADASPFRRTLAELRGTLRDFSRNSATVRLGADDGEARKSVQQFVSWVREQSADIQVGAVTTSAQRAAEIAAAYISNLNANIGVGADTGSAVAQGKGAASRINQMSGEIGVSADTDGVWGEVQNAVRRTNAQRASFDVGANTRPASAELAGFNQTIRRYSRSWGQQGIRARVQADTSQAQAQVRNLERILQRTAQGEHRVRVEAEVARARGQLRGLQQVAEGLGMQNPTVSTSVRGAAASAAQLVGLYALADRLDGYNVRFSASVDQTISKILPQALGALEQQVTRFRTVLTAAAAVSVPVFQTAIAALPGALSMAGAAVGALTTRLGMGLVGAMGSVGSAAVLGGAALGTYGYAMRRTLSYAFNLSSVLGDQVNRIEDAKDAQKQAAAAVQQAIPGTEKYRRAQMGLAFANQNVAFEQRRMNAMLGYATPNMLKLNAAANDMSIEFIRLGAAVSDASAPMLTQWIRGLTSTMQRSRGAIVGMMTDMNRVAGSFVRVMGQGQNLASLQEIFSGIRRAGVPAMQILTGALQVFVNTFSAMVPAGLRVLNIFARLTQAAGYWSSTAAGQARIRSVWASLTAAGAQLWRIVRDLSIGLGAVLVVLNRSGIGQAMMAGLEGLAASFRRVMEAGNGGRSAVARMAQYTRPALAALASLAAYVGQQFGAMAMEVAKSGVITDTINAIKVALEGTKTSMGIIPALRHEFEVIGPLLPPLIKQLGLWFSTFMYAQPEMVLFIKTLTRVLEAFNSLPQPVQRTMARMLAWGSVIQMLGGTALIGLIAKIVLFRKSMATMNAVLVATGARSAAQVGIFGRMKMAVTTAATATWTWVRAQTAAAVASARAGLAAAASAVKVRLLSAATRLAAFGMRAMGVAATFMLGPWGLALAAVVALGAGLVIAYRRSETFRSLVNSVASFIATTAVAAFRGLLNIVRQLATGGFGLLRRMAAPMVSWFVSNLPLLRQAGVAAFMNLTAGVRGFISVIRFLVQKAQQAWPAIRQVFAVGAAAVVAVLRGAWNAVRLVTTTVLAATVAVVRQTWGALTGWFRQNSGLMKQAGGSIWTAFRAVTMTLFKPTVMLIRAIWSALVAFWRQNNKHLLSIVKSVWTIIRSTITTGVKIIGNIIRLGLQVIAGDWRGAWNTIKRIGQLVWNQIKTVVKAGWNIIKSAFKIGANAVTGVWRALWNALKTGATAGWNFVKNIWNSALGAIQRRIELWNKKIVRVFTSLAAWAKRHWTEFWSRVRELWHQAFSAIGNRADSWRQAINDKFSALASWARQHWTDFWTRVRKLWHVAFTAIGNRADSWRRAINDKFSALASWARGHWSGFWGKLRSMWDTAFSAIGDRARSWGEAIRSLFRKVKGYMTEPMEAARDILKGIWNTILGGIGKVLGAVGLDDAAGKVKGAMWAKGGTTEDGGGRAFANGGTTVGNVGFRQFANGGMGTGGKNPRVHLWNEQMGNEAYITERGDPRKQTRYLQTAASWHGMDVVPSTPRSQPMPPSGAERVSGTPLHRTARFAEGGLADVRNAARAFAAGGFAAHVAAANQEIASKFNLVRPPSTYPSHGKYGAPYAADYWVTGYGQKAMGAQKATGDAIASHIEKNGGRLSAESMIWYDQTITGSGRGSYNENNPYYAQRGMVLPYNTRAHFDHVHTQYTRSGEKGSGGLMSSGGGGFFSSLWDMVGNALWNRLVQKPFDNATKGFDSGHVLKQGSKGAAQKMVLDPVKNWIIGESGSSSGGNYGGINASNNRDLGQKMLAASGVPGSWGSLDSLWQKESNWDNKARNPSSGAYGIPQALPPSKMGPDANPPKSDPKAQIAWGLDYIRGRYGSTDSAWGHSQRVGWYGQGGIIPGVPGSPKLVMGHSGERVLPRDLNAGFESLARSISLWSARTRGSDSVSAGEIGGSSVEREIRGLRQDLQDLSVRIRDIDDPANDKLQATGRNGARQVMISREGVEITRSNNEQTRRSRVIAGGE